MNDFINKYAPDFEQVLQHLKKELAQITTGRANPDVIQHIPVEAYDSTMKLQELASVTIPEARVLLVTPWDKTVLKQIVSALKQARLDMQILVESDKVRLITPQLTEEKRKEYVKNVKMILERSRFSMRRIRDKIKDTILQREKEKEISEDERFTLQKELDDITQDFIEQADTIADAKTTEIIKI